MKWLACTSNGATTGLSLGGDTLTLCRGQCCHVISFFLLLAGNAVLDARGIVFAGPNVRKSITLDVLRSVPGGDVSVFAIGVGP